MTLAEYRDGLTKPLRQVTLCFLIGDGLVLLALKKRGFGQGKWNGVGGKLETGETLEEAAIRETQEEIDVTPVSFRRVATINFYFLDVPPEADWNQQVCVFLVDEWNGEPAESEEMAPKWFAKDDLPFGSMWQDDAYWLPGILAGKLVKADFLFYRDQEIREFEMVEGAW